MGQFDEIDAKDLKWMFDIDVTAPFMLCKRAQEYLVKSQGKM